MIKVALVFACGVAQLSANHAMPSSLLQMSSNSVSTSGGVTVDGTLNSIKKQVAEFQSEMDKEVTKDKEEVRMLQAQQRDMDRQERAFKAKIFARRTQDDSSLIQTKSKATSTHFGDPYIDEAMRTITNEIDSQKRELERIVASNANHQPLSFIEAERPDLGIITAALKSRLAMVGK